jgi:uncharacterized membrane-anchored protein YitT (DUF2179 family)
MITKYPFLKYVIKYLFLSIGAVLAAVGLEVFLIPNQIIDGGVVGISIMLSYLSKYPLGLFIFCLNLPFLFLGYLHIGKTFVYSTLFAVSSLSIWVTILEPVPGVTSDVFLAAIFGGIILGTGIGLIIRYGGSLDGTEIVAIILDKKTGFSVGEIVLCFNIFILGSAAFVFGLNNALYSMVAYLIAFKVIDLTIEGLDESKEIIAISDKAELIAEKIMARLGRSITYLHGRGGYSGEEKELIFLVATRLEIAKLKTIITEIDPGAFVTINNVHEVMGGRMKKKIH